MKENKTKPDIRFKGFTEAWEQRKLRDEAIEILAGGDIDKEKLLKTVNIQFMQTLLQTMV